MWRRQSRILVLIDLIQDADVLLPVLGELKRRAITTEVIVSGWLATASPRTAMLLRRIGLPFRYAARSRLIAGRDPRLAGVAAVLLASESSQDTHQAGHALALRAADADIPCATLQHGLDMSGLTRDFDVRFASTTLFTWSDIWSDQVSAVTRGKIIPAGRPGSFSHSTAVRDGRLGVFENLHWDRYGHADRRRFLEALDGLARARPALSIIARAHPAGGWLDGSEARLASHHNVTVITSAASRVKSGGAVDLLAQCAKVITTPSTLALDAAQAGCAVALAMDGGALMSPLPVVLNADQWIGFADSPPESHQAKSRAFAQRVVLPGDATARIVDWLASHAAA